MSFTVTRCMKLIDFTRIDKIEDNFTIAHVILELYQPVRRVLLEKYLHITRIHEELSKCSSPDCTPISIFSALTMPGYTYFTAKAIYVLVTGINQKT